MIYSKDSTVLFEHHSWKCHKPPFGMLKRALLASGCRSPPGSAPSEGTAAAASLRSPSHRHVAPWPARDFFWLHPYPPRSSTRLPEFEFQQKLMTWWQMDTNGNWHDLNHSHIFSSKWSRWGVINTEPEVFLFLGIGDRWVNEACHGCIATLCRGKRPDHRRHSTSLSQFGAVYRTHIMQLTILRLEMLGSSNVHDEPVVMPIQLAPPKKKHNLISQHGPFRGIPTRPVVYNYLFDHL